MRNFFLLAVALVWTIPRPAVAHPLVDLFRKLQALPEEGETTQWRRVGVLPLYNPRFPTYHPQGVRVIGNRVYLSTVQGQDKGQGHLIQYRLNSEVAPGAATPVAAIHFPGGATGRLNHAGGIDGDENFLYVPLAEYRREGPAEIMQVSLSKFGEFRSIGTVKDHIGTLVYGKEDGRIRLFDWSTGLYSIPYFSGSSPGAFSRARKKVLDSEWEYQDCKNIDGEYALCSAKSGFFWVDGEIQLVRFGAFGLEVIHRVEVPHLRENGKPGGMRPLTFNAMDFTPLYDSPSGTQCVGFRFYFVPHDQEDSHLFIFDAIVKPVRRQVALTPRFWTHTEYSHGPDKNRKWLEASLANNDVWENGKSYSSEGLITRPR